MNRLIAMFRRSKCCGAKLYWNITGYAYCSKCNQSDRFKSDYWRNQDRTAK